MPAVARRVLGAEVFLMLSGTSVLRSPIPPMWEKVGDSTQVSILNGSPALLRVPQALRQAERHRTAMTGNAGQDDQSEHQLEHFSLRFRCRDRQARKPLQCLM